MKKILLSLLLFVSACQSDQNKNYQKETLIQVDTLDVVTKVKIATH